jgi:hypothetical protein
MGVPMATALDSSKEKVIDSMISKLSQMDEKISILVHTPNSYDQRTISREGMLMMLNRIKREQMYEDEDIEKLNLLRKLLSDSTEVTLNTMHIDTSGNTIVSNTGTYYNASINYNIDLHCDNVFISYVDSHGMDQVIGGNDLAILLEKLTEKYLTS